MTLSEKVAYIKGLCDGLEIDNTTKEGKILAALLDLVDDMAKTVEDHEEAIDEIDGAIDELNDYAEELDDDLAAVEDFLDGECDGDCENCDECDDCEYDCNCEDEDEDDFNDEEYYEVVCPSCGRTVNFDCNIDPENLICPACQEKFSCIVEADDLNDADAE